MKIMHPWCISSMKIFQKHWLLHFLYPSTILSHNLCQSMSLCFWYIIMMQQTSDVIPHIQCLCYHSTKENNAWSWNIFFLNILILTHSLQICYGRHTLLTLWMCTDPFWWLRLNWLKRLNCMPSEKYSASGPFLKILPLWREISWINTVSVNRSAYPIAMTSAEFLSVTKLFTSVFKTGSSTCITKPKQNVLYQIILFTNSVHSLNLTLCKSTTDYSCYDSLLLLVYKYLKWKKRAYKGRVRDNMEKKEIK
jgi:hypothetical protein